MWTQIRLLSKGQSDPGQQCLLVQQKEPLALLLHVADDFSRRHFRCSIRRYRSLYVLLVYSKPVFVVNSVDPDQKLAIDVIISCISLNFGIDGVC